VKIPIILRKFFENMAAESGSLPLKEEEFTCMNLGTVGMTIESIRGQSQ
jgi:hypothetical protein